MSYCSGCEFGTKCYTLRRVQRKHKRDECICMRDALHIRELHPAVYNTELLSIFKKSDEYLGKLYADGTRSNTDDDGDVVLSIRDQFGDDFADELQYQIERDNERANAYKWHDRGCQCYDCCF